MTLVDHIHQLRLNVAHLVRITERLEKAISDLCVKQENNEKLLIDQATALVAQAQLLLKLSPEK